MSVVELRTATPEPLLGTAGRELRELVGRRELLRYLVSLELRTRTSERALGYLWWVLDPLLFMGIYYLFMHVILKRGTPDYPLFVFAGMMPWRYFSQTVGGAIGTTQTRGKLMRQVRFPKAALPLSAAFAETVHFAFGLVIVILFGWVGFHIQPTLVDLFCLPILVVELILILGIAFFASGLNVIIRDIGNMVTFLLRAWFFLSPVLYPLDRIPPNVRAYERLNPFAIILPGYRNAIIDQQVPSMTGLFWVALGGIVFLVFGYLVFVRVERYWAKVQ